MKTTILFICLLVFCTTQDFNAYISKFKKNYSDDQQRAERQAIYIANWEKIHEFNAKGLDYQLGQNIFTDRTQQEAKLMAGVVNKLKFAPQQPTHPQVRLRSKLSAAPLQVDWRSEQKVSTIKNQGSCGSCWAFTTAALYESILMIAGFTEQDLSQQYLLECTTQNSPNNVVSSCDGGILEYAIPFIVGSGAPIETDAPYLGQSWTAGTATPTGNNTCNITNLVKQTNFTGVYQGSYTNLTITEMKDILSYAPVAAAMYVEAGFYQYSAGVYTGCPDYDTSVANLNHAVVIVGYDANGNYIIKNSWDTRWGENGFATISKDFDCGLAYGPRQIRGINTALQDILYQNMLFLAGSILSIIIMISF